MRAQVLTGFGGPEMLQYRDDLPDPVAGPGEVRIRVAATGINNTDIWTREGRYGAGTDPAAVTGWRREPLHFPRIQGADVVGYVDQLGAGVDPLQPGDRVLVDPVIYSGDERELARPDLIGSERDGGFADYLTVPASNAHRIVSPLSDPELATFPIAYGTALRMLNRAGLTAGETVLVTGASGGVGSALLQLVAARGAHPVAVVGPGKQDAARELGAVATVERDTGDLAGALATASTHGSVDVVADVVGGPLFGQLLEVLAPFGRYVTAGAIAGPLVETDLRTVYLKQLHLIGSSFSSRDEFTQLRQLIEAGRLQPLLAGTYPLAELSRAQADFAGKRFFGKLVIVT